MNGPSYCVNGTDFCLFLLSLSSTKVYIRDGQICQWARPKFFKAQILNLANCDDSNNQFSLAD